ncbi:MAG TPA: hypothetical protein VGH94_05665 [Acidimicrobiales bacterium]|jgi:hypothetical protein
MAAERSVAMAPTTAATMSVRTRVLMPSMPIAPFTGLTFGAGVAMYPSFASLVSIGCGVGSPWTNASAVNTKATKAFGHDARRLLEHST